MPPRIWNPFLLLTILLFLGQMQPTDANLPPDPPNNCAGSRYPSTGSGFPDAPFTQKEMEDAMNVALKRHNHYRALHGASPLTLNSELNARAQHSANCHVKWFHLTHTGKDGENLYKLDVYNSEGPIVFNATEIAIQGVDSLYEEYCWGTKDPKEHGKGHFTQLVWKSSTHLGLGFARSIVNPGTRYQSVYLVGRYLPPGNYIGETDKQVGKLDMADDEMCCRKKEHKKGTLKGPESKDCYNLGSRPGKKNMAQMVAITWVASFVLDVLLKSM